MIPKAIDDMTIEDILALIANEKPESRTLDYKQTLGLGPDDERKDLLADVSSFANTSGGDIVFGVEEKRDKSNKQTGIPKSISGLNIENMDSAVLALTNLIRDGIEPQIIGIRTQPLLDSTGKHVIVMRIPSTYNPPHMVTLKQRPSFWGRTSVGKYPMDISAIRAAFAISQTAYDRIQAFRSERRRHIERQSLAAEPRMVLQVYPLSATVPGNSIDLGIVHQHGKLTKPLATFTTGKRFNADGHLSYYQVRDGAAYESYVQVFRNGVFEAVDTNVLSRLQAEKQIIGIALVMEVIDGVARALELFARVNIEPPVVVMFSIFNVPGFSFQHPEAYYFHRVADVAIDRPAVEAPEVIISEPGAEVSSVLRPTFDAIYQAGGWERCPYYDSAGTFQQPTNSSYTIRRD